MTQFCACADRSRDLATLLNRWRRAITDLRKVVTPDPDGEQTRPNYGADFTEDDYSPIPRRDLPFGVPPFLGDDRPFPDDLH
jgi:hypothetical protein